MKNGTTLKLYKNYYQDAEYSDDRHQWTVKTFFTDTKNKRILDIGCGSGILLNILKGGNEVYGIDGSETGLGITQKKGINCSLLNLSTDSLPFPDNNFDVVICLEVIEHLKNPYHCLKEIRRVLKKRGLLIISIPNPKTLHPYFYPGFFTIKNFRQFLELMSFKIEMIAGYGQVVLFKRLLNRLKKGYLYNFIYFVGRKTNVLMRNHIGTPLTSAHCFNFRCINNKSGASSPDIEKQLSLGTRPQNH